MLPQPATAEPRRFLLPPQPERANGQPRHVGVELEFVALEPREAGELTQALYGGTLVEISPFYFELHGSRLGDFRIELDRRGALRLPDGPRADQRPGPDAEAGALPGGGLRSPSPPAGEGLG
jgi:hypothetical protein